MIDYGLLVSMIIAFGVPSFVGSWWTVSGRAGPVGFFDVALWPAFTGLAIGRITTLAIDDPSSIGRISDMLIVRSGVEFWPGVTAAIGAAMLSAHLGLVSPSRRISELAPLAMVGYASYEASCIFRDGCYGPRNPIGLRPPGLSTTMLPVGWIMALAIVAAAFCVHGLVARGRAPIEVAVMAAASVASVRSVASLWLPHVGDGLTRQHLSSLVVAAVALVGLVAVAASDGGRGGRESRQNRGTSNG